MLTYSDNCNIEAQGVKQLSKVLTQTIRKILMWLWIHLGGNNIELNGMESIHKFNSTNIMIVHCNCTTSIGSSFC